MPRPSFSHNPLLRVSRPVSACSRCRAAKVKCDGKLPACTACEKAGRSNECSAANDQFARGKERSYVAALELRIEKLEKRLQFAKSRKASVALHDTDASAFNVQQMDRRDSLALIRAAIHRKAAQKRETSDVNSLVSDFGFLLVLAATTNDALPESDQARLPPRQTAHVLVQHYMDNVYSLFPCFSETSLLTALDDIYQEDTRTIKDSDYWMVYMVLAIGSTAQSKRSQDTHYLTGLEYASRAMNHADGALTPGYVTQIQSLLLLTHAISMVHARTFSFTDDTVNVAFPQASNNGRKSSASGPITGPRPADPALLLFQLRRAQSHWYQELYQSGSVPLQDPISYIWKMCLDMREWQDTLPTNLAPEIRQLFDQELRYSYVYCIAPSARAPSITDYNRILIFEHSMAYLDTVHEIAHGAQNSGFYTYHDVLRVYFMANQFLAVLRDAEDMLLSGMPVPIPISRPGAAPAPPLPRRLQPQGMNGEDNLDRSLRCLDKVSQTLDTYGDRWADASTWRESFGMISQEMVDRLSRRRQARDTAREQYQLQYQGRGIPPQTQAGF
ncbi:GAL4-like transcriptional activator [Fusarium subglutinans]|uniref:GAL4-like transcriptional activator n=1 Tax=Gibberella subglutinans TaxID=42677 RepID=A0A8H5PVC2_GIBSU|nr:GAL4-like transcriptional activator [Fusarium subglutinans]KAF5603702.1 GAL4-like transcriptional activator [Fusarium subglutinans]